MRDMNGNVCALQSRQDGKVKFSVFHGCVFVCVGEIPHSIEGDVFIDVDDDEQPLMPDQVEPAADTHTHRFLYSVQMYFSSGNETEEEYALSPKEENS